MLPGICIPSPGLEAGGALGSSSAMVEQGIKVWGGGGEQSTNIDILDTLQIFCKF